MEWEHALNYWRKVFTEEADGHFTKSDFDEWFRNGADLKTYSVGYFSLIDEPGSADHFSVAMRTAFIQMLQACVAGRFGKQ